MFIRKSRLSSERFWYKLLILAAALVANVAFAGMYDQPYALVERGSPSETRKEATLGIVSVDGERSRDPRKTDPIPPGKHRIKVHFESSRFKFSPEYQDIELDFEACTRYRVVASYEIKSGPNWKPKVYSEPIGECRKKFSKKEGTAN
jgi:hypothetical protein